jgi:hypothetical protein
MRVLPLCLLVAACSSGPRPPVVDDLSMPTHANGVVEGLITFHAGELPVKKLRVRVGGAAPVDFPLTIDATRGTFAITVELAGHGNISYDVALVDEAGNEGPPAHAVTQIE